MKDGLPVQATSYLPQSTLYTTEGFDKYTETVKAGSKEVQVANNVSNRFLNREARFYNTVFFQNRRWHVTNNVTQFHKGSPNELSGTIYTHTGYMLYKRFNREVSMKSPGFKTSSALLSSSVLQIFIYCMQKLLMKLILRTNVF